ncbi:YggT family protein [Pararhodospirillum oryzae]|uniref:YggT family protein n=1 Tax=Pararhodospirillum oryzae TaxID=478448 RepID=A0A512HAE4_9PROT|nr:YggT family protein [Pararhodospirillum oryzae]GEO82412.1 YggT family protein [Pararhodospirillum oryzae]
MEIILFILLAVGQLLSVVIITYIWTLIAAAVVSWLVALNVLKTSNPYVESFNRFLILITEPVLRPVRRIMPNLGPIDLSPMVVILVLVVIESILRSLMMVG